MIPRATYRLQLNRDFPFASAEALVPYLDRLGISHIYASPITKAVAGSMHGYDVVDPTVVSPELGGEDGLRSLAAALRARGMGIIIDIVPNHMGVASGENRWWNDVLRNGPGSDFAHFFDIDWRDRLLLPILGAPLPEALAAGDIAVERDGAEPSLLLYGERRLPLRPGDYAADQDALAEILERQHYRLGWWRSANDELNWRRFFTISELAGLRTEDPDVFETVHRLCFRLYREGLIDGVRVDHVDGLTDPAGYCRALRTRFEAIERPADAPRGPAYIIVEKILGRDERLPADWAVDGTTGYDFMDAASALLHDPPGEAPLTGLLHAFTGRPLNFDAEALLARQQILRWSFEAQLQACVEAFAALARTSAETDGLTLGMLRRAVERMLWICPVYRTYGTGDAAPVGDAAIREQMRDRARAFSPPGEAVVVDRILAWLAGHGPGDPGLAADAVRRFQQLSAPIAAKSVEDTAFYRYGRLLSRNDVGFDPGCFSMSVPAFHDQCVRRAIDHAGSMLATATHDHKRGEDVRARLAVLSELPDAWQQRVGQWESLIDGSATGVSPGDRYPLYQMLVGAWPAELDAADEGALAGFGDRLVGWQRKALREAKLRSSWESPELAYEQHCADLIRRLLDPALSRDFLSDLHEFVAWLAAPALANILAQTTLRYTVPGVPDCYQGCEFADFSMVDPDNRQPVAYAPRVRLLADPQLPSAASASAVKLAWMHALLSLRRDRPKLFAEGLYEPIALSGRRADHAIAFRRVHGDERLTCVVALRCASALAGGDKITPDREWWDDTALDDGTALGALLVSRPAWVG